MWRDMKRRVYIIAALALANVIIMKYQESRKENRMSAWAVNKDGSSVSDSLLSIQAHSR